MEQWQGSCLYGPRKQLEGGFVVNHNPLGSYFPHFAEKIIGKGLGY